MYKYFVNNLEVFPLNSGNEVFKYELRDDGGLIFNKNIEGDLIFKYNNSNFNFKNQELLLKCDELVFRVEKKCGSIWAIWYEGVFTISEGEFDDDNCLYKIKPRARNLMMDSLEVNMFDDPVKVNEGGVIGIKGPSPHFSGQSTFPNCRYFENFLPFIAKRSNNKIKKVISNFFQINPDGVFYLPGVTNWWSKMVVASMSDISYPVPSNPAIREVISFRDLMSDLNTIFNVNWIIDVNYNLRVEHVSFFEGGEGLDLTQNKYMSRLTGFRKYTYNLNDYPKKETWKIYNNSSTTSLTYNGLSDVSKNGGEKIYSTSKLSTDYGKLVFGSASTDDGILLIATDGGTVGGFWYVYDANSKLKTDVLVRDLHCFNRPSLHAIFINSIGKGDLKAGGIILKSIKPTKLQTEIKIPLCCEDVFNPEDTVKTDMGVGYVHKAEFSAKTDELKLQLKYKVDNCVEKQPNQIQGLDLWLKYNDVVHETPGGPYPWITHVSQWNDSSGHNRHATQANETNKPWFVPGNPNGNPVAFFNSYLPTDPVTVDIGMFLKTPAFPLFPNKRGTIFIVFNVGGGDYGGSGWSPVQAAGFTPGSVLSTQDGGAGIFFDLSFDEFGAAASKAEGTTYPAVDLASGGTNSLLVIRRSGDISIEDSFQTIPSVFNPMTVSNTQPDSKPLVIGWNEYVTFFSTVVSFISEVIVYNRDLTDEEIEDIQFYLIKKKLLTL